MDGWREGRLSPSASLLRAPYGANKLLYIILVKSYNLELDRLDRL